MPLFGAHMSVSGGVALAFDRQDHLDGFFADLFDDLIFARVEQLVGVRAGFRVGFAVLKGGEDMRQNVSQ